MYIYIVDECQWYWGVETKLVIGVHLVDIWMTMIPHTNVGQIWQEDLQRASTRDAKRCEPQRLGTFRQQKERVPKHAPKLNFEIS